MNEFLNKNKIKLMILALSVVMLITSASYAWFTATVSGNPTSNNVVTSGKMEITYTDGQIVGTATNMIPGQYITKTFTVRNTGNVATSYDIYLNDVVNTFVDKNDLVYTLTSSGGGTTIGQTVAPSTNTKIASSVPIAVNATHTYTLTLRFLETSDNQDDNKGASFTGRISLIEVQQQSSGGGNNNNVSSNGTIASCPDCYFVYNLGEYIDGYSIDGENGISGMTKDYRTLNSDVFLGFKFDESSGYYQFVNSYVCGIEGGIPFCLKDEPDANETYDEAHNDNVQLLSSIFSTCSEDNDFGSITCNGNTVSRAYTYVNGREISTATHTCSHYKDSSVCEAK